MSYSNPVDFRSSGKTYELLQAYFNELSLDTLRDLLNHESREVRMAGVWIMSELGQKGESLIDDIIPLLTEDDRYIKYNAIESVAVCSTGSNVIYFSTIFKMLNDDDEIISNEDNIQFKNVLINYSCNTRR